MRQEDDAPTAPRMVPVIGEVNEDGEVQLYRDVPALARGLSLDEVEQMLDLREATGL